MQKIIINFVLLPFLICQGYAANDVAPHLSQELVGMNDDAAQERPEEEKKYETDNTEAVLSKESVSPPIGTQDAPKLRRSERIAEKKEPEKEAVQENTDLNNSAPTRRGRPKKQSKAFAQEVTFSVSAPPPISQPQEVVEKTPDVALASNMEGGDTNTKDETSLKDEQKIAPVDVALVDSKANEEASTETALVKVDESVPKPSYKTRAFNKLKNWYSTTNFIPKKMSNFVQNVHSRYLTGTSDVVGAAGDLLFDYTNIVKQTGADMASVAGKAVEVGVATATGGISAGAASLGSGLASYAAESANPMLTVLHSFSSLNTLRKFMKLLWYTYKIPENTVCNLLGDSLRSISKIFTKEKVFLSLFEEPEVYRSVVDNYTFDKYFKPLVRTVIAIYSCYHLYYYISAGITEAAATAAGTVTEVEVATSTTSTAFKKLGHIIAEFKKSVNWTDIEKETSYFGQAKVLWKMIFSNNIALKQFQQWALTVHQSLLGVMQSMTLLDSKFWNKHGFESMESLTSYIQDSTNMLSAAMTFQTKKLDGEIYVNKGVKKAADAVETGVQWAKDTGSSVYQGLYQGLSWFKSYLA